MRWSDRSALPARRSLGRAGRPHARQGWKTRESDRSYSFLHDGIIACRKTAGRQHRPRAIWCDLDNRSGATAPPLERGPSRCGGAPSRRHDRPFPIRNASASIIGLLKTIVSHLRHEGSFRPFAARSDPAVAPPPTLIRLSDRRMPWVGIGARFALMVRELTPIQEISDDSLPYSIFGQRFITTLMPAASAFAAAASSRAPSCIQITFGNGDSLNASSTTGMMWVELRKISTMSN